MHRSAREFRGYAQALTVALVSVLLVLFPQTQPAQATGPTPMNQICQLSGSGTVNDPYLMANLTDLYESTDCATQSTVILKLTQDISLSGTMSPIGFSASTISQYFSGVFDGDDYSITGINISYSNETSLQDVNLNSNGVGLFWGLWAATFQNVTFEGSLFAGNAERAGGIAGEVQSHVDFSNVTVDIDVRASASEAAGGFLGRVITSSITASQNLGDVTRLSTSFTANDNYGGFVGEADEISFATSTNSGFIEAEDDVGGFVGEVFDRFSIVASVNLGNVGGQDTDDDIGGFIGHMNDFSGTDAGTISGSVNRGEIRGDEEVGGFVGDSERLFIQNSTNEGPVTGDKQIGGFVGYSEPYLTISSSVNQATVSGSDEEVGGFVGGGDVISIATSTNSGFVEGEDYVGGFIGEVSSRVNIIDSVNLGNVGGPDTDDDVGGFIGHMDGFSGGESGTISGSVNRGAITGSDQIGGFVGDADELFIHNSVNEGPVTGDEEIGGFVGYSDDNLTISSSVNQATVSGSDNEVGGFVGDGDAISIATSTNSGSISGYFGVGGFVGDVDVSLTVFQSVMTGAVSGSSWVGGVVGDSEDLSVSEVLVSGAISGQTYVGGVSGKLINSSNTSSVQILNVLVQSSITATAGSAAGLFGSYSGSPSVITISNTLFSGEISAASRSDSGAFFNEDQPLTYSANLASVASYWALAANSDLLASPAGVSLTSVDSGYLAPAEAYDAASYIGWDFTSVWAFGDCSVNNGLPTLRFAVPSATSQTQTGACFVADNSVPATTYVGPVIQSVTPSVASEGTAQIRGLRLDTITRVFVGGQEVPFTLEGTTRVVFDVPELTPGTYQTIFFSAPAQVNLTGTITILGAAEDITKVNVGSFNGKLVVYALNLDGSRITWKVGGIWGQDFASGNQLNRFDRLTPRKGVTVKVDIFVDGVKRMTKNVLTR
jgi:hypothetical protein